MPYRQRALVCYKKMLDLLTYSFSVSLKPIWVASGLLILGVLLTWTTVFSIRHTEIAMHMPQKPVQAGTQEVQTDLPVLQNVDPVPDSKPTANVVEVKEKKAIWPVQGKVIRGIGWYENPVLKEWRYHAGYDIAGTEGEEVKAAMDGEVTEVTNTVTSGLTVVVKSREYVIYYGSLAGAQVAKGDSVTTGTKLGTIGSFTAEPFPHLHLVIKKGEKNIEPNEIIKE